MEFWLGLAVRYRLPRRKRVESPSLELVRNLADRFGLIICFFPLAPSSDHLAFPSCTVTSKGFSSWASQMHNL